MTYMVTSKRQKNVLVVCDELSELKVISSLMEKVDFRVLTVPTRATSVEEFARRGEPIDLAIIDVGNVPAHDPRILHSLHESYPKVRLVFLSSDSEGRGSEIGPAGHVRGYLRKPVRKAQLLGTILTVMDAPAMFAA